MQKIALIPSYEPNNKLLQLVYQLKQENIIAIVINDGSSAEYDSLFSNVKQYAHVISYKENCGKGFALKTGLNFINNTYKTDDYIIVTMDSDGQHTINDAIKLCNYIEDNLDCIVLGKRLVNKNIPLRSRFGNTVTRFIYKLATGVKIYDTQTGLRAFSNKLTQELLNIPGNRYEYEMNVLLFLARKKIKIHELKIETIYFDKNSNSHFNPFKDSARIYIQIIKFIFSSVKLNFRKIFKRVENK